MNSRDLWGVDTEEDWEEEKKRKAKAMEAATAKKVVRRRKVNASVLVEAELEEEMGSFGGIRSRA